MSPLATRIADGHVAVYVALERRPGARGPWSYVVTMVSAQPMPRWHRAFCTPAELLDLVGAHADVDDVDPAWCRIATRHAPIVAHGLAPQADP